MATKNIESKISSSFRRIGLSPIVQISEEAEQLASSFEKKTGRPFIFFQRGEVGFDMPAYVAQAFSDAVLVKKLTKYPKSGGAPWFKDAVISHMNEMKIEEITRDNVVATYGGQEGLELAFLQFEGCKAAAFGPIWSAMLENILPYAKFDWTLVPFKEEAGRLKIDAGKLEEVIKDVDVFYLNTPHNPTGKVFSREEMSLVNELCRKNNVLIISDEAYKDLVYDGKKHTSMLEFDGDHIISVFTGSKSFAATGLRMGYSVSRNKKIIENMTKGNYSQTAGLSTPQQHALTVALRDKESRDKWLNFFVKELQERRDIVYEGIKAISNGSTYMPEGAFYFFINLNKFIPKDIKDKDKYLLNRFMDNGIAVVYGSAFGKDFEGYTRLSFSTLEREVLKEGVERLKETLSGFSR
jgi:aspartate aminotransferase